MWSHLTITIYFGFEFGFEKPSEFGVFCFEKPQDLKIRALLRGPGFSDS